MALIHQVHTAETFNLFIPHILRLKVNIHISPFPKNMELLAPIDTADQNIL